MSSIFAVKLEGLAENSQANTIELLASLFKKSEQQMVRLIDAAPIVIKSQLNKDEASKYKQALEQRGAKVSLVEKDLFDTSWSLEPTEDEKQSSAPSRGQKAQFASRDLSQ